MPDFSAQECSECGYVSPTNRDGEKFICQECRHHEDADVDAAKVILQRGLDGLGIYLDAVPRVLGNRIKVPRSSLLQDRENHPRWWVSLGTIR